MLRRTFFRRNDGTNSALQTFDTDRELARGINALILIVATRVKGSHSAHILNLIRPRFLTIARTSTANDELERLHEEGSVRGRAGACDDGTTVGFGKRIRARLGFGTRGERHRRKDRAPARGLASEGRAA